MKPNGMDIDRIEKHRLELEQNAAKLEKSLRHWQLCSAEYEALREEVDELPMDASQDDFVSMSKSFAGDAVTEAEIIEIFGIKKTLRSAQQVSGLLSRRIDYTQQNVNSVSKQLDAVRQELDPSGTSFETGMENDQGQSMMEIVEELDDDDKVISSKVSKPGESAEAVIESLKKAGMSEKDWVDASALPSSEAKAAAAANNERSPTETAQPISAASDASPVRSIIREPSQDEDPSKRKSVSFASDTKAEPVEDDTPRSAAQPELSSLLKGSFSKNDRVWQLDDNENAMDFSSPHIPIDESPEDAALRRQMLQYNMNEVGAVVAQLDLEELGSSDEDSYDDDENLTGDSEEEEHGMSTRSSISTSYREEMRQLEEKLNASVVRNVGQGPLPEGVDTSELEPVGTTEKLSEDELGREEFSRKKSVRFSEEVDIAPPKPSLDNKPPIAPGHDKPAPPPMIDAVIERPKIEVAAQTAPPKPQKVSRFKSSRTEAAGASRLVQRKDGPLADTVVERASPVPGANVTSPEEDDLHPEQLRRELAQDYYRRRNKFIQRQGGFLQDEVDESDEDEGPAEVGEENEAPKKVSRFMAARVKPDKIW